MGIFDALQNLVGGATDAVQGPIQDALGGIADVPALQDVQDIAASATDAVAGATDAVAPVVKQAQTTLEDFTSKLGL